MIDSLVKYSELNINYNIVVDTEWVMELIKVFFSIFFIFYTLVHLHTSRPVSDETFQEIGGFQRLENYKKLS